MISRPRWSIQAGLPKTHELDNNQMASNIAHELTHIIQYKKYGGKQGVLNLIAAGKYFETVPDYVEDVVVKALGAKAY